MKSLLLLTTLAAMGTLLTPGQAQNPAPPALPDSQIRIELLVVQMPEARALDLQPELRDPDKVAAGQNKILAMIRNKEAKLVDWPVLTTRSGNRAVVENIDEFRYAIEYDAPKIVVPPPADPTAKDVEKPEAPPAPEVLGGDPAPAPPKGGAALAPQPRILAGVPSTFETRNVGVTLEIEPNINADGKTIDAQLAPQHVRLVGMRREKLEVQGKFTVVTESPEFETKKVSTNLTLASGQAHLLSFYRLRDEPTVELFLLKMTIVPTGKTNR